MTNMSPDEIASLLDRERSALDGSIKDLRGRLTFDALLDDVLGYAKANAAPYARALDGAVRANPAAAVLAGVGLAWLVLGRKSGQPPAAKPLAGSKFEALARREVECGPAAHLPEPDQAWISETDRLRQSVSAASDQIDAAARQGLRPAADLGQERDQAAQAAVDP